MATPSVTAAGTSVRRRDAARTREEILAVATAEFTDRGYSGARVDEIAERTRTTKRMIYYYFGGKEALYIAVLERVYSLIRHEEQQLDVEHLDPVTAIRRLAELTFDHHEKHPEFVRLVSTENIHYAKYIAQSAALTDMSQPAVSVTGRILERGYAQGVFTRNVEALDLHMLISAFCFFRVANRYTFGTVFGRDILAENERDKQKRMLGDVVVDYLTSPAAKRPADGAA